MEYEASYKLHERLEVKKLSNDLCMKLGVWCNALHSTLHMVHNVGSPLVLGMVVVFGHFVCETVIATSSLLDNGIIQSLDLIHSLHISQVPHFVYDSML